MFRTFFQFQKQEAAGDERDGINSKDGISVQLEKKKHVVHLPRPCGTTKQQRMQQAQETGSAAEARDRSEGEVHWAVAELRTAMKDTSKHKEIPKLIATWPLDTLRYWR